jgi:hypothetical protein
LVVRVLRASEFMLGLAEGGQNRVNVGRKTAGGLDAALMPGLLLFEEGKTEGRWSYECAAVAILAFDETAVVGILPDGKARTGRSPSVEHLIVGPVPSCEPLKQIKNQGFHYDVGHRASFLCR